MMQIAEDQPRDRRVRPACFIVSVGIVALAAQIAWVQPKIASLPESNDMTLTQSQVLALGWLVPCALLALAATALLGVRIARTDKARWIVLGASLAVALATYGWAAETMSALVVQVMESFTRDR